MRFLVGTIKEDCLERMIFFNEDALRKAVHEFVHLERNHQGLGNQLIRPRKAVAADNGDVGQRRRLGGMLNFYYRDAA